MHYSTATAGHLVIFILVFSVATYRVTRLVIEDKIFQPLVAPIQGWAEDRHDKRLVANARTRLINEMLANDPDSIDNPEFIAQLDSLRVSESDEWRSFLAYLFSCPWCMSLWVASLGVGGVGLSTGFSPQILPHSPGDLYFWWWAVPFVASAMTGLLATFEYSLDSRTALDSAIRDGMKTGTVVVCYDQEEDTSP